MADKDLVTSILSGMAETVMAPINAAVELATTGDISTDTGTRVILGEIGEAIGGSDKPR